MKFRLIAFVLILTLFCAFCGCGSVVSDIAGNVADAAMQELEQQVKKAVEEYKVQVVEVKSAVGKLNNESDSDLQFFCGVLVRSNSDMLPQIGYDFLGDLFEQSGIQAQRGSKIENELLVNKEISFNHKDFSADGYYMIWVYTSSLTQKLSEIKLPTDWLKETEAPSVG